MNKFYIKWFDDFGKKNKSYIKDKIKKQLIEQGVTDIDEDTIESLVVDAISRNKSESKNNLNCFICKRIISLTLITTILISPLLIHEFGKQFISKSELKIKITNIIKNGGDVDDLKSAFPSLLSDSANGFELLLTQHNLYEKKNINLLQVLEDIKTEILSSHYEPDENKRLNLNKIKEVIYSYNKINPFDGLDEGSKRDLRSIVEKLDENQYLIIKEEISNLTKTIKEKNSLIETYLSSSNISLLISVAAFLFSVVTTIWQLWISRGIAQKKIIEEVLANSKKINDDRNHE